MFSTEERIAMLKEITRNFKNVEIHSWDGIIVKYAQNVGAKVLVRGVRNEEDFRYEFEMSLMNKTLDSSLETVFLPTDQQFSIVKSSLIKDLIKFGVDISKMVPPNVEKARYDRVKS